VEERLYEGDLGLFLLVGALSCLFVTLKYLLLLPLVIYNEFVVEGVVYFYEQVFLF
jgi:hypothetical protein